MFKCALLFVVTLLFAQQIVGGGPDKVYALWYCGDDQCDWASEPNTGNAQWIVNRGDGKPTANVVIFSFVDPLALAQGTNDAGTVNGVPKGMTKNIVNFFTSKGIAVIFSIGGEAYTGNGRFDRALADPTNLARKAAAMSKAFGVGVEIDYENENSASLSALNTFVQVYRSIIPPTGQNANLLTVDLGAGTGYLTAVSKAASVWLQKNQVDWANAMVGASPYGSVTDGSQYWQQHLDGVNWDQIPPVPPKQLVVSLYASSQSRNCKQYSGTVLEGTVSWVNSKSSRGISFWAAGLVNDCNGIQQGSQNYLR